MDNRISALDGIRGVAVLMVLLNHFAIATNLYWLFPYGWMGVDLFFVLSGFLITGILLDTKHQGKFIKSFFIRRALRILPLYYGILIIFSFLAPHFGPTHWWAQYQFYFWTHTENLMFLFHGFQPPLGHFWSLALEEQFYLFWPFIVLLTNNKQLLLISSLLIVTSIVLRAVDHNPMLIVGQPFAHLDGIAMGSIIAILIREKKVVLFRYHNVIFLSSLLLFMGYILQGNFQKTAPLSFTIIALFFASILIQALHSKFFKIALSNRTLLFFGKYSYGMYIFHQIIVHYIDWAGADKFNFNGRILAHIGGLVATIIISYLSYQMYESKFLKLKDRFKYLTPVETGVLHKI